MFWNGRGKEGKEEGGEEVKLTITEEHENIEYKKDG